MFAELRKHSTRSDKDQGQLRGSNTAVGIISNSIPLLFDNNCTTVGDINPALP